MKLKFILTPNTMKINVILRSLYIFRFATSFGPNGTPTCQNQTLPQYPPLSSQYNGSISNQNQKVPRSLALVFPSLTKLSHTNQNFSSVTRKFQGFPIFHFRLARAIPEAQNYTANFYSDKVGPFLFLLLRLIHSLAF